MVLGKAELKSLMRYMRSNYAQECLRFYLSGEKPEFSGSRIGGLPYWREGMIYPRGTDGTCLTFLLQINLGACPKVGDLPENGLLQVFLRNSESFGCDFRNHTDRNIAFILHHHTDPGITEQEARKILMMEGVDLELAASDGHEVEFSPVKGSAALRVEKSFSLPAFGDWRLYNRALKEALEDGGFACDAEGPVYVSTGMEFFERINTALNRIQRPSGEVEAVMMLGHPDFKNINPLPEDSDLMLLMKVNSVESENCTVSWLNEGIADFFIEPANLKRQTFKDLYYTWDFETV